MYRRYIIVGLVFFLLIGAYFVFFDKDKGNKEYEKYYNKLVEKDQYSDVLDGIELSIIEVEENNKYDYMITFDNASEKKENVKILVVNPDDEGKYFPSFGMLDNKGYSIVCNGEISEEKDIKGVNLTILDSEKIEYLLIYFSSNNNEQFVKVNVVNYLD